MKKNIIVCLVSDQTIHNVLFIKEFLQKNDEILLITTDRMEAKEEFIKRALKLPNKFHRIVVNEHNDNSIQDEIKLFDFSWYTRSLVNITGGTKLMSIEIFDYFKNSVNSSIYYITLNNTYKKIFPIESNNLQKFKSKVTISEYFNAYGFDSLPSALSEVPKEYTYDFFRWFVSSKTSEEHKVVSELQKYRSQKKILMDQVIGLKELLINCQFPFQNAYLTKKDVKYLTGEWLEEFIYYKIQDSQIVSLDEIVCGISRKNMSSSNEFDVVFLYDNELCIVECKTYIKSNEKKSLTGDTIYKLDSTLKDFGLRAKSYIVTLNKREEINESDLKRAQQYGIKILTLEDLINENFVENNFMK